MNLAQSQTIPRPAVPINVLLPDLARWQHHSDAERIAERRQIIAKTLAELKTVLVQPMELDQIRELMPDAPRKMKDWVTVWTMQGHLNRKRVKGRYVYSLAKGE